MSKSDQRANRDQARRTTRDIDRAIALRIHEYRVLIGIDIQVLADHLGLTFQAVDRIDRGENRVSAGRLYEIARVLGVTVDYLCKIDRPPESLAHHRTTISLVRNAGLLDPRIFDHFYAIVNLLAAPRERDAAE